MFSADGAKVRFALAFTVPLGGGGDIDVGEVGELPPQPARRARQIREVVRIMIASGRFRAPDRGRQ
jgi:hypothetical protein